MKNPSPIWHPFTQHGLFPESVLIDRAEGACLYTPDGRRIVDGVSSWWVNIHGHCHPKIVDAVREQASKLDQVIFAGFTHEPAERLAEKLLCAAGPSFSHVFFSDSGSTAVEVALKMAVGFWHHGGRPRHKIAALEHGYHGDTFGTMAAGARGVFSAPYERHLFQVERLPFPDGDGRNTCQALERLLHRNDLAALVLEPLVLGAGGMLMYTPDILKKLHALCRDAGVLFIADEVMTGWGRTGTRFACEQAGVLPDITCLSKGLTNGFLPLGATLCRPEIYDAFCSTDRAKTFFHSSSFTANPLACAAAAASLDIWDEEPVTERIAALGRAQERHLRALEGRDDVRNLRRTGTIAAFDVAADHAGYLSAVGPRLYLYMLENGVLLRPLGNTVYVLPPYCISEDELAHVYGTLGKALDSLRDGSAERAV